MRRPSSASLLSRLSGLDQRDTVSRHRSSGLGIRSPGKPPSGRCPSLFVHRIALAKSPLSQSLRLIWEGAMRIVSLLAAAILILGPLEAGSQAGPPARPAPKPSENAGRKGTYQAKTSRGGYNYYVCVPAAYSDENPAGLHLFFHGQNSQSAAPKFGTWPRSFLDPHNLIGINMQYEDGDNARDTEGKVK